MRRAGFLSLVFISLLGCTPGEEDAFDSGMEPDSGPGSSGLRFQFHAEPPLSEGGVVGGDFDVTLDEAELRLANVRAIGDAAPGDERTSIGSVELEWEEDDVVEIYFGQAPPGLYSQLLADVTRFELDGWLVIDGQDMPFTINTSFSDLALSVGLSGVDLEPGMGLTVPIRVELDRVVHEIDWRAVPEQEGVITLDDTSPQIDSVRGKIKEMISAGSPEPIE